MQLFRIFLISLFLVLPTYNSFADEQVKDPDLKLSLEELKKKYPISLLDEKNKSYKEGQKINIDDYSNAEIKAAFLNAEKNFKKNKSSHRVVDTETGSFLVNKEVITFNPHEISIIEEACCSLKDGKVGSVERKALLYFIFSNHMVREYINPFISVEASNCLFVNDPLNSEYRD
jgi:hypothetical protein